MDVWFYLLLNLNGKYLTHNTGVPVESAIGKKWKSMLDVGGLASRSATQSPATVKPLHRRSKTPTPRTKTPTPLSPPPRSAEPERSVSPFKYGNGILSK